MRVARWGSTLWPRRAPSRLESEMLRILQDEALRKRFNELGMEASPVSQDALAERIRSEASRFKQIIEQSGYPRGVRRRGNHRDLI